MDTISLYDFESTIKMKAVADHLYYGDDIYISELVYTSFDGDFMNHIPQMIEFTLSQGRIPINPELSLGYFVSTTTYDGDKVHVMEDCLSVMLICDKLWVFKSIDSDEPEGVLAEKYMWACADGKDKQCINIDFFDKELVIDFKEALNKMKTLKLDETWIKTIDPTDLKEIKEKLPGDGKGRCCYIIANFFNYKHLDWARSYCYKNELCPISPQNIMPHSYYVRSKIDRPRYISARLSLLNKCDKIYWFVDKDNILEEIDRLDEYSIAELYYCLKNKKNVEIIDWKDAAVPKYLNPNWALTTKERRIQKPNSKNIH